MKENWKTMAFSCVSVIVMMLGFWLVEGREYVSRVEMEATIQRRLDEKFERVLKVESVLEKNTEVLNKLQIEIAVLNATLKGKKE